MQNNSIYSLIVVGVSVLAAYATWPKNVPDLPDYISREGSFSYELQKRVDRIDGVSRKMWTPEEAASIKEETRNGQIYSIAILIGGLGLAGFLSFGKIGDGAPMAREGQKNLPCRNCGALLSSQNEFCSQCGFHSRGDEKLCPFCAEEIQAAAKFCKHCGREMPPLNDLGQVPTDDNL